MTSPSPKLLQLYSLRAQVDALIAQEESELVQVTEAAGCPHPEDRRIPSHNMGQEPEFFCSACSQFVKGDVV